MTKLVIVDFTKGFYDDKKVCAYINYGSKDKPLDNLNNLAGNLQDPSLFIAHLQKVVVPLVNAGLKNSAYVVECVECENMIPRPFLSIRRLDKANLSADNDMMQIRKLLDSVVAKYNKKVSDKKSSPALFPKATSRVVEESKGEYKPYNLRARG